MKNLACRMRFVSENEHEIFQEIGQSLNLGKNIMIDRLQRKGSFLTIYHIHYKILQQAKGNGYV